MPERACDHGAHTGLEEALQTLQLRNEEILNTASEGIYGVDLTGRVTFANPAAARLTGHAVAALLGQPMHELIHHTRANGRSFSRASCPIYAAFVDGVMHHVDDDVFWRKDGSWFGVQYTSTPIRRAGKLVGALIAFEDVSAQRRVEGSLRRARAEVARLRERLAMRSVRLEPEVTLSCKFGNIIGESAALQEVLRTLAQVAPTDATVLIEGESGTGKELLARALHKLSTRAGPMVTINCGAIPPALFESELFGHEKGAFTGAIARRVGRFEQAAGGTLFLDEVADLSLATQAKLLRVLQERSFSRVGSNQILRVDARVVAATQCGLRQRIAQGTFRLDLFYRLNAFTVTLPPLRARKEDIPLLVSSFLRRHAQRLGRSFEGVAQQSMALLLAHDWPGNVRELENVIQSAAILSDSAMLHVPELRPSPGAPRDPHAGAGASEAELPTLADLERQHILRALERTGFRVAGERGAGALLGVHPNTLRSRMKRLGISAKRVDHRPAHEIS